jgi:anti-anti-sigma factor
MANADRVGEQLAAALTPGVPAVIADMTATTFCDSRGIRMLVLAGRLAKANGTQLRLLLPQPNALPVIEVLGLHAVLPCYRSLEEAQAGPAAPGSPDRPPARPDATGKPGDSPGHDHLRAALS